MAYRIVLRRDTSTNWLSNDPVLLLGEPGYETDLGGFKIGDGETQWSSLPYVTGFLGATGPTGPTELGINLETSNYTLSILDSNSSVEISSATNSTFTIPSYSSVEFPLGTDIILVRGGTGEVGITGATGVTLNSAQNYLNLQYQYSSARIINKAQNVWYVFGDLKA